MNDSQQQEQNHEEEVYESYGWDFHKIPLFYAAVLTALFYAFIYIYFNMD